MPTRDMSRGKPGEMNVRYRGGDHIVPTWWFRETGALVSPHTDDDERERVLKGAAEALAASMDMLEKVQR